MHTSPKATIHDYTCLKPAKRVLELILDTLQRKDSDELFAEPVDPSKVENYSEIISDPMDFGTMRAKLHEDMYNSIQQFEKDVHSIFSNAMNFNSSGTAYFKQARALDDMANKVFQAFKTDPEKFELEYDTTKRRSTRKICSDRDSNMGSSSKLHRDKRSNGGERKSVVVTRDGRATYKPRTSLLGVEEPRGPTLMTMYLGPTTLVQASQQETGYRESLMAFVKDLGPTAKRVAQRKMIQDSSPRAQIREEFINVPPPRSATTTKVVATCSQRGDRARRRNAASCRIMNKKIVLAVPASPRARGDGCTNRAQFTAPLPTTRTPKATTKLRRSAPKTNDESMNNLAEKAPKKRDNSPNHPTDNFRKKRAKGGMEAPPSRQLNRLDLNEDTSGPTTTLMHPRDPWKAAGEKDMKAYGPSMATTRIHGTAGCSYYQYEDGMHEGQSSGNMGRDFYFDLSYVRSRLHGTSSLQSSAVGAVQPYVHKQAGAFNPLWPCLPNSKSGT